MKQKDIKDFYFEYPFIQRKITELKVQLFKSVSKKALPLFTKNKDIISLRPQVEGCHEPAINALIHFLVEEKSYRDFLLDIGANIGLTSCQVGKLFSQVHLFEPNRDCVRILKVNCRIALAKHPYKIHKFGLGEQNENCDLHIPINNWGGAFIQSKSNNYTTEELTHKDNFKNFNPDNYLISKVKIKNARNVCADLFANLQNSGAKKGVIKIDVEGYEKNIIQAIIDSLPQGLQLAIIFENWSKDFVYQDIGIEKLKQSQLFLIDKCKTHSGIISQFLAKIFPIFNQHRVFKLNPIKSHLGLGNFLLVINK